jgi:hypothetical protein
MTKPDPVVTTETFRNLADIMGSWSAVILRDLRESSR